MQPLTHLNGTLCGPCQTRGVHYATCITVVAYNLWGVQRILCCTLGEHYAAHISLTECTMRSLSTLRCALRCPCHTQVWCARPNPQP